MPCDVCRLHYSKNIKELPIRLDSKDELTKWLFDIHNKVNESINKKLFKYDDFIQIYSDLYNPDDNNKNIKLICIILFILLVITIIYKKIRL